VDAGRPERRTTSEMSIVLDLKSTLSSKLPSSPNEDTDWKTP